MVDFRWWPGTESNCRHYDFQSYALPTELPGHVGVREMTCGELITIPSRSIHNKGRCRESHEGAADDVERKVDAHVHSRKCHKTTDDPDGNIQFWIQPGEGI